MPTNWMNEGMFLVSQLRSPGEVDDEIDSHLDNMNLLTSYKTLNSLKMEQCSLTKSGHVLCITLLKLESLGR